MTNITTNLESSVLSAIALHEMSPTNGGVPERIEDSGTYCWVEDFATATGLQVNQVKGVLSSLVQKELIVIREYKGEEPTVDFTQAGFEAYRNAA